MTARDFDEARREMNEKIEQYFEAWFANEVRTILSDVRRGYSVSNSATSSEAEVSL